VFISIRNKNVKILIANAPPQLCFKENITKKHQKNPTPKPQNRKEMFKWLLFEKNEQWRLTHMNAEIYKGNKAA